ncbi:histidine phosphatase family protein [Streptomyces sp. JJ66]|uniref:histidine phosphatase family protein n=1 Tax=Streptomyces sp. JJ66 TaxID=2803843 RepID=UPI001C55D2D6|nr:histidine phosphatase family protein [Streptomyces sp. JJ66]MBW1602218.1 histidine phosphatase family protein [Streptomyces sp. JJ66]
MTATRYLYLTRHGEAVPDESTLSETGRRQAALLGVRLRDVPLAAIYHGPLARATESAHVISGRLPGVPLVRSEEAGDYVPYRPGQDELPSGSTDRYLGFLARLPAGGGAQLAARAVARFTGPVPGDRERHELVVTHNFLAGWLVRDALDAPRWRWLGLNHDNAALTVIRYVPGRPAQLVAFNDAGHLRPPGAPRDVR